MGEPFNAARAFEPDPIPSDVPATAAIRGDIERGYSKGEGSPTEADSGLGRDGDNGVESEGKLKEKGARHGKGLTEGDADMEDIPYNRMILVMPSIGLVLFLAALDQTIVATALPTIAEELNTTPSEYQWIGTSYLLAALLQGPMNGRVSDIVGRKPMLYGAVIIFFISSALCGAAKTSSWLIIARAFQGLGGGAIIGLTSIVTSDITPMAKRGWYQGLLGLAWSVASVLGPILGGILTQKASWRWCFYINLPTCGIALVCLFFNLNLNQTKNYTFRQFRQTFDFLGLAMVMAGGALLVVGFAFAADHGFSEPSSYGCIAAGCGVMALAIVNCLYTKRNAIIPARMFSNRTTLFFLIGSLLQATAFIPINFILPQLFQGVTGADSLTSGLMLLPFAFSVSICTTIGKSSPLRLRIQLMLLLGGYINSKFHIVRPVAWFGYAFGGLGYALFYAFFTYPLPLARQSGLQIITGVGIGCSIIVPLIVLQSAMPLKEMAATTGAWSVTRNIGGSVGLAVFTAILNTGIRTRFAQIPGYGTEFFLPQSVEGYAQLHNLPEGPTKDAVLTAFADSLRTCWIAAASMMFAALLITLPTRSYSTNRTGGKTAPVESGQESADGDGEFGEKTEGGWTDEQTPIGGQDSDKEERPAVDGVEGARGYDRVEDGALSGPERERLDGPSRVGNVGKA